MAAATASATRPGSDCQVPKPTEGILAPVLRSKNRISFAIFPFFFFSRNPNNSENQIMFVSDSHRHTRSLSGLGGAGDL